MVAASSTEPPPSTLALQRIVCGSMAGVVTKTCISPLERIKIVLQVRSSSNTTTMRHFRYFNPCFS